MLSGFHLRFLRCKHKSYLIVVIIQYSPFIHPLIAFEFIAMLPPDVMVFIDSDYDRDSHMPVMMVVVDLFDQEMGVCLYLIVNSSISPFRRL